MKVTPETEGGNSEGPVAVVEIDLHGTVAVVTAEKVGIAVAIEVGDGGATVFATTTERPVHADGEGDVGKRERI